MTALALFALVAPANLYAQSRPGVQPSVLLLDARGPLVQSSAALHALAELRRAFNARSDWSPTADELRALRDAHSDPALAAAAVEMRRRADEHFRRLENALALRALGEAMVLHARRFADVLGDPEAARAATLAAAISRSDGLSVRMREELRRAIAFDPQGGIDSAQFPPELVVAYEAERAYLTAAGIPLPPSNRLCEAARLIEARVVVVPVPNAAASSDSLSLDVYDAESCERRSVSLSLFDASLADAALSVLTPAARPPDRDHVPPPRAPGPEATDRRWYTRWYTLLGAGALLVGGIAAVLASTAALPNPDVGVRGDGVIGGSPH